MHSLSLVVLTLSQARRDIMEDILRSIDNYIAANYTSMLVTREQVFVASLRAMPEYRNCESYLHSRCASGCADQAIIASDNFHTLFRQQSFRVTAEISRSFRVPAGATPVRRWLWTSITSFWKGVIGLTCFWSRRTQSDQLAVLYVSCDT